MHRSTPKSIAGGAITVSIAIAAALVAGCGVQNADGPGAHRRQVVTLQTAGRAIKPQPWLVAVRHGRKLKLIYTADAAARAVRAKVKVEQDAVVITLYLRPPGGILSGVARTSCVELDIQSNVGALPLKDGARAGGAKEVQKLPAGIKCAPIPSELER
jgi:hypothetical protein